MHPLLASENFGQESCKVKCPKCRLLLLTLGANALFFLRLRRHVASKRPACGAKRRRHTSVREESRVAHVGTIAFFRLRHSCYNRTDPSTARPFKVDKHDMPALMFGFKLRVTGILYSNCRPSPLSPPKTLDRRPLFLNKPNHPPTKAHVSKFYLLEASVLRACMRERINGARVAFKHTSNQADSQRLKYLVTLRN